ncbi:MAG: AMP-binding protein [Elusimicrobia bacterium]|nr:AMP-binding protein [Elusimicrobiota bacterium]
MKSDSQQRLTGGWVQKAPAGMLSGGAVSQALGLIRMLVLESVFPRRLQREPEPGAVMDSVDQVRAWDHQGEFEGPIDPVYHFAARAVSLLVPRNGLVIDLGCGTGRFLTHLATLRPDLHGLGFDLSPRMVFVGNENFREKGLSSRVSLRVGDMTKFSAEVPPEVDVVVSLFSLHHLPTAALRDDALDEIAKVRRRTGASVWFFDLARPRRERTIQLYPAVFSPDAPESFRLDSVNSLKAAWTFRELKGAVQSFFGKEVQSVVSRGIPLFQAHWVAPPRPDPSPGVGFGLVNENGQLFRLLRALFPSVALAPVSESVVPFPEPETLPGFLLGKARRSPDVRFGFEPTERGRRSVSWQELYDGARDLARGLAWLGMRPGDRVGILMPNSLAWEMAQFGIHWAGGIVVGLDPFMSPEGIADIIKRSQCTGLIIQRLDDMKEWDPMTRDGFAWILTRENPPKDSVHRPRVMPWSELSESAQDARIPPIERVRPEDPAAIIFTSGTTGKPKGLAYTHGQFSQVRRSLAQVFNKFGPKDLALSWLPLSNLFQRIFNLVAMERKVPCMYLANPREIMTALTQVKPTLLIGVPRFFEKGRQGVLSVLPRPARWIFNNALRFAQQVHSRRRAGHRVGWTPRIVCGMWDLLIFRWLRRVWGGRLRLVISGSAPCSPEVLGFFEAIGMPIHESYGVSEIILPVAVNPPGNYRIGSVGKPFPGQEVHLAEDGEVLVRGPFLHKSETWAPPPLTPAGWWPTGDLGRFDEEGYLYLIGRRSEVIKTSHGRRIALPALEAHFRDTPGIDQVVIVGHGRPRLVAVMGLVPGTSRDGDRLAKLIIEKNAVLPHHERLAAVLILAKGFSPLVGELTPNLKIRRIQVEKRHSVALDSFYADLAESSPTDKVIVRFESEA